MRHYASFHYRAKSWSKPLRVVAKVEFHASELFPRLGFIATNRSLPNERVLAFYNGRGTAEQHIKEGKSALKWTRLSCIRFAANAVRLQLHALAYNLANFLRTLATPKEIETWSLTSLRERLIKTGARLDAMAASRSSPPVPTIPPPFEAENAWKLHSGGRNLAGERPNGICRFMTAKVAPAVSFTGSGEGSSSA